MTHAAVRYLFGTAISGCFPFIIKQSISDIQIAGPSIRHFGTLDIYHEVIVIRRRS